MAWNSQGGGQGPWGGGGGNGGDGGPKGPTPPDIEEILRRIQDKLKSFLPGGAGGMRGLILIVIAVVVLWGASGFYRVDPGQQGVELLFGKFVKHTTPGLNYWFPAPIGEVLKPNVERTNTVTIGFREVGQGRRGRGVYCQILKGGTISKGDVIYVKRANAVAFL